jgi:glycosyltransferase involved in cell wall biosynthesis
MKILQVNTFDSGGGAAKFCVRLKKYLDNFSTNWLLVKKSKDENNIQIGPTLTQKILNKLFSLEGAGRNTFSLFKKLPFWNQIDLIHFHNLHGGFFNICSLSKLSKEKKCIWTLHDPWIINNKKELVPEYKNIFKTENLIFNYFKTKAINDSNIILVTPSVWLKEKVQIEYPNKKIVVINNGVDIEVFSPLDKEEARNKLELPTDKKIILFTANGGIKNTEKGSSYLEEIEKQYRDVLVIKLGGNDKYIENEKTLALYYSSADLLLFPSLAENFPLSILEAMSCGTPVVAFNTGGIAEIINHKINGYVSEYKNIQDLINGINFILEQKDDSLRYNARKKIMEKFDSNVIFKQYLDLYKETTTK